MSPLLERLHSALSTLQLGEVEALLEVATFCSRRKIGALIAIEREVGLGGIAESGTRINADISAALLNQYLTVKERNLV